MSRIELIVTTKPVVNHSNLAPNSPFNVVWCRNLAVWRLNTNHFMITIDPRDVIAEDATMMHDSLELEDYRCCDCCGEYVKKEMFHNESGCVDDLCHSCYIKTL